MSSLTELRERVERATGPDRELDIEIAGALFELSRLTKKLQRSLGFRPGSVEPQIIIRDRFAGADTEPIPYYTASIDAALALVERKLPGAEYDITTLYGVAHVDLPLNYSDQSSECGRRADGSVPLAILTALLRALESQEQDGG